MGRKPQFTAVSLFSGCGGSDAGLADAGVMPVWANEIDPIACELYSQVTGFDHIECGDVSEIDRYPKADLLVGCYPCQGYSQGGRRKGQDSINYLYREFDRALRQVRPLAFIVENVDGMRFAQNHELLRNQLTRFRSAGYRVCKKVLDAKEFGLAQDRRRLFIVGIRTKESKKFVFPEPLHGPLADRPYATQRDVIWNFRDAPRGSFNEEPLHWYYLSRNRRRTWGRPAHCIVAHWRHVGLHPDSPPLVKLGRDRWAFKHPGRARRLSYFECAALQGFPEPKKFRAGTVRQRFKAIGNAVPPALFSAVASALIEQLGQR